MQAGLLLPHQLFENLPFQSERLFLYEDPLFFEQFTFHKSKLFFHCASMSAYAEKKGAKIIRDLDVLKAATVVEIIDPIDDWALQRLSKLPIKIHTSPGFLLTDKEVKKSLVKARNPRMSAFYADQRVKFQLLLDENKKPLGGKWSFDAENRKRLPKGLPIPALQSPSPSKHTKAAEQRIGIDYVNNPGKVAHLYPTTHEEAKAWLKSFVTERLESFGPYEDFISKEETFLFHSALSPLLNTGLLTPHEVIDALGSVDAPLNSTEGFIRQVIGWREFIRGIYVLHGGFERTHNFFNFHRPLPKSFWDGTTGIDPVDNAIRKVLNTGYCHHIERLMVLGCFMLLCEIDPSAVYTWFMELFIDAYDWVMVPNVYGMSQFADGGLFATKPYLCGSNYILKMSDYKKGPWCEIWDGLYWRFIDRQRSLFERNHRSSMMVRQLDKMPQERKDRLFNAAEQYINHHLI